MQSSSSGLTSVPWPVLALGAWIATVIVAAALIYAITKTAINKSDARDLPQVLSALAPLLGGMARSFIRVPTHKDVAGPAPTVAPASVPDQGATMQTGGAGSGAPEAGQ